MDPERYSRQMRVAGIGAQGQQRISASTALVVGVGALGTHAAQALARAGVGTLWLCDRDIVEWHNLQRQVLFTEADAMQGLPKAVAAAEHLRTVNSRIAIEPFVAHCSLRFLDELPARPDLVLDGTDNFATRYLINDWCARAAVPWIYAGAVGTEATAMVVLPGGPCLRCLWPEAPSAGDVGTCETAGVLAPAIAAATAFQTAEALKLLAGADAALTRGLFTADVWRGRYQVLGAGSGTAADCPVCRSESFPALTAGEPAAALLCGRDAVQVDPPRRLAIDLEALARRLGPVVRNLEQTPHLLRFSADGCRFSVFPGGRALLFGIRDLLRARALYDRWIGAADASPR